MFYEPNILKVYEFRNDCELAGYQIRGWQISSSNIFYTVNKDDLPILLFGVEDDKIIFAFSSIDLIEPKRHLEVKYHQSQVSVMGKVRHLI